MFQFKKVKKFGVGDYRLPPPPGDTNHSDATGVTYGNPSLRVSIRASLVIRHKFIHESYDIRTHSFSDIGSPTFGLLDTAILKSMFLHRQDDQHRGDYPVLNHQFYRSRELKISALSKKALSRELAYLQELIRKNLHAEGQDPESTKVSGV